MPEESTLERAVRHIVAAKRIIESQRSLIEHLKRKKLPTAAHEEALQAFERSLASFEEHETRLRADKTH